MADYVNNKELYEAFLVYKEKCDEAENSGLPRPMIPDVIGKAYLLIATKIATRANFSGYTYKEEMIGDAIENCVKATYNFDPSKGKNPFGYFTRISWFAFLRRIESEKKETYIKYKTYVKAAVFDELFTAGDNSNYQSNGMDLSNEKMIPILEKFDKKPTKKKEAEPKGVEKFVETSSAEIGSSE